jgi:hypothetical protein
MGCHIIHGSVGENILIQNSIVLIQEKEAPPGLSRERARRRAREESSRGALQLQRQQTEEEAEAEKENKELATRATEGELD